jgi:hypothetical protein
MSLWNRVLSVVALVGLSLASVSNAKAAFIPVLRGGAPTVSGGVYTYTYDILLSKDSNVNLAKDPAFVTFYDFRGYVAGSAQVSSSYAGSGSWNITEQAYGKTAFGTNPTDAADTNITFNYTNSATFVGPKDPFLTVTLQSIYGLNPNGQFTEYTGQTIATADNSLQGNIGLVWGPNLSGFGGNGGPGNTPEPGTVAMLVSSTFGGLFMIRRRK